MKMPSVAAMTGSASWTILPVPMMLMFMGLVFVGAGPGERTSLAADILVRGRVQAKPDAAASVADAAGKDDDDEQDLHGWMM